MSNLESLDDLDSIEKCKEKAQEEATAWVATLYSKIPTGLRATFAAVGGPIATFIDNGLSQTYGEIQLKRIENLLNDLASNLKDIKEEKIDKAYLGSEQFCDVIDRAIEYTRRTESKSKIAMLARIISEAIAGNVKEIKPLDIINILGQLSEEETIVFAAFYHRIKENGDVGNQGNELKEYLPSNMHDRVIFFLKRLEGAGLLNGVTDTKIGGGGQHFYLTSVGKLILESTPRNNAEEKLIK